MGEEQARGEGRGRGRRRGRRRRRRKRSEDPGRDLAQAAAALVDGPAAGLDLDRPAAEPLSPEESEEAGRRLAFIRRYRKVLRLPFNDAENLLIDGARPPEHRGQLKHLLSKVDKAAAVAALRRKPVCDDPRARAGLLEGVARVSGDLDVLLMWLEALPAGEGREQAAGAFGAVVERIDFERLSPSRTDRVVAALMAAFDGAERVQALFGLLESPSFRAAFEACAEQLDQGAVARLGPLAEVHRAFIARRGERRGEAVEEGLRTMLAAPAGVLRGYRPAVREALAGAAVRRGGPVDAVEGLLKSLAQEGDAFQRHAWSWACRQVADGHEGRAREWLRKVSGDPAQALREALEAPRVAGVALVEPEDDPERPGLRRGYELARQRRVLLRLGRPEESGEVSREAHLQDALCMPGVAAVLGSGLSPRGTPYVIMAEGEGRRGLAADRRMRPADALTLAWDGVRILRAVSSVGVILPDADPARFRGGAGSLELVDLSGARGVPVAEALTAHRALAQAWAARWLPRRCAPALTRLAKRDSPPDFADWAELVRQVRW